MNEPVKPTARPLPWKPFSPVPLDDAAAELKGSQDVPAVRAIMEYLESEIASAADLSGSKDLSRAAGRFEAMLDFHQLITGRVKG